MEPRVNAFCRSAFSRQEKRALFFPVQPRICHTCNRPKAIKHINFVNLSNRHQNLICMRQPAHHGGGAGGGHGGAAGAGAVGGGAGGAVGGGAGGAVGGGVGGGGGGDGDGGDGSNFVSVEQFNASINQILNSINLINNNIHQINNSINNIINRLNNNNIN